MKTAFITIEVLDNGFIINSSSADDVDSRREIAVNEGKLIRRIKELIASDKKPELLTE